MRSECSSAGSANFAASIRVPNNISSFLQLRISLVLDDESAKNRLCLILTENGLFKIQMPTLESLNGVKEGPAMQHPSLHYTKF